MFMVLFGKFASWVVSARDKWNINPDPFWKLELPVLATLDVNLPGRCGLCGSCWEIWSWEVGPFSWTIISELQINPEPLNSKSLPTQLFFSVHNSQAEIGEATIVYGTVAQYKYCILSFIMINYILREKCQFILWTPFNISQKAINKCHY